MTVPKKIPAEAAGFSGCTINARCFYEGSSKERLCAIETVCIRDEETRIGHERANLSAVAPVDEAVAAHAED
jgi:hypothetical protein